MSVYCNLVTNLELDCPPGHILESIASACQHQSYYRWDEVGGDVVDPQSLLQPDHLANSSVK